MARDWRRAASPVRVEEITDAMLAPIRASADASCLPQTVWPSHWFGVDFLGVDCLLTSMAAPGLRPWEAPSDIAEGARPLLTVLPAQYLT